MRALLATLVVVLAGFAGVSTSQAKPVSPSVICSNGGCDSGGGIPTCNESTWHQWAYFNGGWHYCDYSLAQGMHWT